MEEERERLSREREAMNYQEWERKEEEFHREQGKRRTEIRVKVTHLSSCSLISSFVCSGAH
jgi:hypothetical protein